MSLRARAFFDELIEPGLPEQRWARMEKLVADREPESLWLDFKAVEPKADPKSVPFIKDKLARALSGFANTEGGVLVYGIQTTKGGKGEPDAAEKIVPIEAARVFRASLEKLCSAVVDPVIGGVVVDEVLSPNSDAGVVVVLVPESVGGPHRVVGAGPEVNDRYLMRTTTEHVAMPHRLLADRFGRSASPSLQLVVRVEPNQHPRGFKALLANRGRGAARRPALEIRNPPAGPRWPRPPVCTELPNGFHCSLSQSTDGSRSLLVEPDGEVIIYPGQERVFIDTTFETWSSPSPPLLLAWTLYALDAQPITGESSFEMNGDVRAGSWIFRSAAD